MLRRPLILTAVVLLLAMMFLLAGGSALRESVTFDEVAHIGAGVSYWQRLDLRYNPEHPPLAKALAALPLVMRGVHADYSGTIWKISEQFFPAFMGQWVFGEYLLTRWNDPQMVLAWARLPMLILTIALGWLVFACARRIGGDWGALLCVAVYAGTPAFLVFGLLVLTDIPITFFSLLTLWAIAGLWDNPDSKNTLLVGLALGGAILTKFTAPFLFFSFIALSLSTRWLPMPGQPASQTETKQWRKQRWRAMWKAIVWAALIVYAVYFVLSWNQPVDIPGLAHRGSFAAGVGRMLMPAWVLLRGVFLVGITGNRPTFILGHHYPHGVWFYFPVLLILKSPPGFLALLVLVAAVAFTAKRRSWPAVIPPEYATLWRVLWVSLTVFSGICALSHFNVSIRHFTIPLVLLILMLAPLPRLLAQTLNGIRPALAAVVTLLAASCLLTVVRSYPYYFPYINPIFSFKPGYWLVNDSNLDWNQALPEVEQFAQRHDIKDLPLDIYGMFDSTPWVPQARLWDCQAPSDADAGHWIVLSGNMILDGHNCGWLMQYRQQSLAGGSMYAVELPSPIPTAGSRGGPPAEKDRRIFLSMPFEMRQIFQRAERRPEEIPAILNEMRTAWENQMRAGQK